MLPPFANRGPLGQRLGDPGERQFPDDAVGAPMPRTEQTIPAELGQDGAECLPHADGDLPVMDDGHRVHARGIRRMPCGAPLLLDQVGAIRRMEQGRLAGGLLHEVPHEDLGVALERHGLLFAVGRADMLANPLTRFPLVPVGFDDLDQRPLAQLFSAYEHAGRKAWASLGVKKNLLISHYMGRYREFAPKLHA